MQKFIYAKEVTLAIFCAFSLFGTACTQGSPVQGNTSTDDQSLLEPTNTEQTPTSNISSDSIPDTNPNSGTDSSNSSGTTPDNDSTMATAPSSDTNSTAGTSPTVGNESDISSDSKPGISEPSSGDLKSSPSKSKSVQGTTNTGQTPSPSKSSEPTATPSSSSASGDTASGNTASDGTTSGETTTGETSDSASTNSEVKFVTVGVFFKNDDGSYSASGDEITYEVGKSCETWSRPTQIPDAQNSNVPHDHFNAQTNSSYVDGKFTWTEFGPEHSQADIEATCAAGQDGETKTVDATTYYPEVRPETTYYLKITKTE